MTMMERLTEMERTERRNRAMANTHLPVRYRYWNESGDRWLWMYEDIEFDNPWCNYMFNRTTWHEKFFGFMQQKHGLAGWQYYGAK